MATSKIPASLKVAGGGVVLKLKGGSERYLYRGDVVVAEGFEKESLANAIALGLLAEVKETAAVAATDKSSEKDADASADAE